MKIAYMNLLMVILWTITLVVVASDYPSQRLSIEVPPGEARALALPELSRFRPGDYRSEFHVRVLEQRAVLRNFPDKFCGSGERGVNDADCGNLLER